jgi:hypothetical protein
VRLVEHAVAVMVAVWVLVPDTLNLIQLGLRVLIEIRTKP